MALYEPSTPCPKCNARITDSALSTHLAWHDNLKSSMIAANPLVSISLLNGL